MLPHTNQLCTKFIDLEFDLSEELLDLLAAIPLFWLDWLNVSGSCSKLELPQRKTLDFRSEISPSTQSSHILYESC